MELVQRRRSRTLPIGHSCRAASLGQRLRTRRGRAGALARGLRRLRLLQRKFLGPKIGNNSRVKKNAPCHNCTKNVNRILNIKTFTSNVSQINSSFRGYILYPFILYRKSFGFLTCLIDLLMIIRCQHKALIKYLRFKFKMKIF